MCKAGGKTGCQIGITAQLLGHHLRRPFWGDFVSNTRTTPLICLPFENPGCATSGNQSELTKKAQSDWLLCKKINT